MRRTRAPWFTLLAAVGAVVCTATPAGAIPPAGPGPYYVDWEERNAREADPLPSEFKLINYFFSRVTASNVVGDPSGLKGVSLGPIGPGTTGSQTRVDNDLPAFFVEQRWIPVIQYAPHFVDGLAAFRAQFEVDYMWGQAANAIQNNQGGGFNADQVNIQTKNVNVAIYPTRNPQRLSILIGTQSIYDSIYDPTITSLFDIIKTGYKLTYFGTDATGLSVYGKYGGIWKASFIPLEATQPDKATKDDPRLKFAWLATLDYAYVVQPGTVVGLSFWHLQDATKGKAFAFEGLVRGGPASSGLSGFTGTATFNIDEPNGNVEFIGAHFHHNIHFYNCDFAASSFMMLNVGQYRSQAETTELNQKIDIVGLSANLEGLYNWGKTTNDVVSLETMFVSGDSDPTDGKYKSAFTLNQYGLPGSVWFNHKMLLLFPFTQTVSNYTGAVTDISNQGYGLMTVLGAARWDIIPYTLNLKGGLGYAMSTVRPPDLTDGVSRGRTIGLEVNAELTWNIRYLMTVGLHAGYMVPGSFYDGNDQVAANPWVMFTTFTWYAF
ncbi:MAG: hypothetical protein KC933_11760 [Myxococcales bacterium]|nr:hypothetical protein [Myxococcales bacterium]